MMESVCTLSSLHSTPHANPLLSFSLPVLHLARSPPPLFQRHSRHLRPVYCLSKQRWNLCVHYLRSTRLRTLIYCRPSLSPSSIFLDLPRVYFNATPSIPDTFIVLLNNNRIESVLLLYLVCFSLPLRRKKLLSSSIFSSPFTTRPPRSHIALPIMSLHQFSSPSTSDQGSPPPSNRSLTFQHRPLSPTPSTSVDAPNSPSSFNRPPSPPSPVSRRALAQRRRRNRERAIRSHSVQLGTSLALPSRPIVPARVVTHRRRRQRQRIAEHTSEQVSLHLFLSVN